MKKALIGYKISEVNKTVNALREENESLSAEIARLKISMKNNVDSAKTILLEENLKINEDKLLRLTTENSELKKQIEILSKESAELKRQIAELRAVADEAAASRE